MFDDLFEDLIQKKKSEVNPGPTGPPEPEPFGDYFDTGMGDKPNEDVWSSGQLPDYWKTS